MRQRLEELVPLANAGDEPARRELREILDSHPEIWETLGNLNACAMLALARAISGGNALLEESLMRSAKQLQRDLLGPGATRLEELAVSRVIVCHLETHLITAKYTPTKDGTIPQANFVLKAKDSAERRLQAAMKTLAVIRALQARMDGESSVSRQLRVVREKAIAAGFGERQAS